jgi:hypothetical protein
VLSEGLAQAVLAVGKNFALNSIQNKPFFLSFFLLYHFI